MSALTLSSDGSLTIPAAIIQGLGLGRGDSVQVSSTRNQIVVERGAPMRPRVVRDEHGHLSLEADPRSPEITPDLIRDILAEQP